MHEETERPVSHIFSPCQLFMIHSLRTIWQCYLVPARLNAVFSNEIHEIFRRYGRFLEDLGEKVTLSHISFGRFIERQGEEHGTTTEP